MPVRCCTGLDNDVASIRFCLLTKTLGWQISCLMNCKSSREGSFWIKLYRLGINESLLKECRELADLWSLNFKTIQAGASFMLHARVTILLMIDCSSWAGFWSRENVCVRRSHSRWNSCQVDGSLKSRSSTLFSNDFLYLTSTWLL